MTTRTLPCILLAVLLAPAVALAQIHPATTEYHYVVPLDAGDVLLAVNGRGMHQVFIAVPPVLFFTTDEANPVTVVALDREGAEMGSETLTLTAWQQYRYEAVEPVTLLITSRRELTFRAP